MHNLGKAGQGVTICLMIDGLGYDDTINNDYHPSIYKKYSNIVRDVEYFIFNDSSSEINPGFQKLTPTWDTLTPAEKWDEIRELNSGAVNQTHGTFVLSVLAQIAPHADYVFIDHEGTINYMLAAIKWMAEEDIYETYDIEVLSLFWGEKNHI